MATRNTSGDDIDIAERLVKDADEEDSEGRISALFGEYVFHNNGQIEDDGLEDGDVKVDLRDDQIEDIEEELKECIAEVVKMACSKMARNGWKRSYKTTNQCSRYGLGVVVQKMFNR